MSKPDTWMPLYGNDLFVATRGHPPYCCLAYIKAIWYYWHHNHCRGLKNDDYYLRGICECELIHWEEVRNMVFDNQDFFTLDESGLWRQKRTDVEWEFAQNRYNRAMNGGLSRSSRLTDERRSEIARKGALARHAKKYQ
jgi:hypothetical protein